VTSEVDVDVLLLDVLNDERSLVMNGRLSEEVMVVFLEILLSLLMAIDGWYNYRIPCGWYNKEGALYSTPLLMTTNQSNQYSIQYKYK